TSILPLLVSSVSATIVSYLFLGREPFFPGTFSIFSMHDIPYYIILGLFCGLVSIYFIRSTLFLEDRMNKEAGVFKKWGGCALLLGVLIFLFPPLYGEGYEAMSQLLNGQPIDFEGGVVSRLFVTDKWLILLYFFLIMLLKVFATAFTNAGGGVGGTFGPTLITGALAGFVIARLLNNLSFVTLTEANFVLVGMAGLMAGVMQAPLTAIFLIAEITGGYTLLFPLIITSVLSYGDTHTVEKFSIYSKRIAAQGYLLTHDSDQAVLTLLKTTDLIETNFIPVQPQQSLGDLVKAVAKSSRNLFPVVDENNVFQGIVVLDDIRECMFDVSLYDSKFVYNFMTEPGVTVLNTEKMDSVMNKFEVSDAWSLPVVDAEGHYIGFVSKSKIFSAYREQLQQVSNE
ncbi:MAG: chloride channel protein, partial [Bacteroidales bacterium]|nr:chloride channel protein [Bacteroidales bacterium]